jgi:hypothetical protein
MYGTQSLCYTIPEPGKGREIVALGDPRAAVCIYEAGQDVSEARARELGIYDRMVSEAPSGPEARSAAADPSTDVQRVQHQQWARGYVENAVAQPVEVSAAERAAAGAAGATMTGPTIPEVVAQSGDYAAATDKATAETTSGSTPPSEAPAPTTPRSRSSEPPKPTP